ncbi:hypothetical protein [Halogeometricum limi]|uniref:Uncharacterized protein n=1 Tax=Halogeometricum limi TaxID=555875 RepID=A0A1I6H5Z8_9EURY|nr:hypothetical protein [Halogeometricum limi]SFR49903.1 hypothetical protein SAMN04488124_1821 [Halogeometricum limi]
MALIELNFGRGRTDDDSTDDAVEIPIHDDETESSSRGRTLLRVLLVVATVAAAAYLFSRRASAPDDSEFAEIPLDDDKAEAGVEPTDE